MPLTSTSSADKVTSFRTMDDTVDAVSGADESDDFEIIEAVESEEQHGVVPKGDFSEVVPTKDIPIFPKMTSIILPATCGCHWRRPRKDEPPHDVNTYNYLVEFWPRDKPISLIHKISLHKALRSQLENRQATVDVADLGNNGSGHLAASEGSGPYYQASQTSVHEWLTDESCKKTAYKHLSAKVGDSREMEAAWLDNHDPQMRDYRNEMRNIASHSLPSLCEQLHGDLNLKAGTAEETWSDIQLQSYGENDRFVWVTPFTVTWKADVTPRRGSVLFHGTVTSLQAVETLIQLVSKD